MLLSPASDATWTWCFALQSERTVNRDNTVRFQNLTLPGRADFEKFHARLLNGRFKDSTFTPMDTTVRFLRPDMAVVHWSWKMSGDKNFDGTERPPRFGMMTMVAEKRSGTWQVVVAQNTNSLLGTPPELQDIQTPIPMPWPAHP